MCDVVASWSNGGALRDSDVAEGTAEEAELSLLVADKNLNEFLYIQPNFFSTLTACYIILSCAVNFAKFLIYSKFLFRLFNISISSHCIISIDC